MAAVLVLAVLVGVLLTTGRQAVVSACPIAYVGTDGRLHLTNVDGTLDVQLDASRVHGNVGGSTPPPAWSPSGSRIMYHTLSRGGTPEGTVTIQEPMSGRRWTLPLLDPGWIAGWADDDTMLECHVGFRDVQTGALLDEVPRQGFNVRQICPLPPGMDGAYLAVEPCSLGDRVHIRSMGFFETVRTIHQGWAWVPRIGPHGLWVGWTRHGFNPEEQQRRRTTIEIKCLSDPPESPPRILGFNYAEAVFCDWTDTGDILANVQERTSQTPGGFPIGPWRLVILDKSGKLLRQIPTDVPPMSASWRKDKRP